MKRSHYHKNVKHLETIDVYRVLQLFGVTDPCLQHAVKKLLCAGQRGVKPVAKDVQEAIDSLTRWQEMLAEDAVFIQECIDNAPLAPASIQWPESEARMDVIGQNGPTAEHYSEVGRCPECIAEHCACVSK